MEASLPGYNFQITPGQYRDWSLFFREQADKIPHKQPAALISAHAEANRVIPPGGRFAGSLSLARSPYLIEPMDNMSPASPVQHTAAMKAAQGGWTMGCVECPMCYYIGEKPADQLLLSASEKTIRTWAARRMEPAIDSYGYRKLIFSQSKRPANKQSGDTLYTKQYPGGQLDLGSSKSASSTRSTDKQILLRDEVDGSKEEMDADQGGWLANSEARTNFWGDSRKIMDISTPLRDRQSAIQKLHALGDQRVYLTPCPYCQKFILIKFRGFQVETEAGRMTDIWYKCNQCGDAIFEKHKAFFLTGGHWEPTAQAWEQNMRSYHWASWLAPLGALTWKQIYFNYEKAKQSGKSEDMKDFVNLYLGKPYKETGARPSREKVIALQGNYRAGTVPDRVLFLTMAVDVQRGSADDKANPPRLELEVLGHGSGYRTWSICYETIPGEVKVANAGAWEKLVEWMYENPYSKNLIFNRKDSFEFPVRMIFVDSGDGTMTDVVYKFTEGWPNTYPISGFSQLTKRKKETGDEMTTSNLKRFRLVNNNGVMLYQISTNHYKHNFYSNLNHVQRKGDYDDIQAPGFCDFPADYKGKYFDMLRAEEKREDGSFYAGGRRNEALDARIYNLCAGDVYLQRVVDRFREQYKKDYHPDELKAIINHRFALKYLSKSVGVSYE